MWVKFQEDDDNKLSVHFWSDPLPCIECKAIFIVQTIFFLLNHYTVLIWYTPFTSVEDWNSLHTNGSTLSFISSSGKLWREHFLQHCKRYCAETEISTEFFVCFRYHWHWEKACLTYLWCDHTQCSPCLTTSGLSALLKGKTYVDAFHNGQFFLDNISAVLQ